MVWSNMKDKAGFKNVLRLRGNRKNAQLNLIARQTEKGWDSGKFKKVKNLDQTLKY